MPNNYKLTYVHLTIQEFKERFEKIRIPDNYKVEHRRIYLVDNSFGESYNATDSIDFEYDKDEIVKITKFGQYIKATYGVFKYRYKEIYYSAIRNIDDVPINVLGYKITKKDKDSENRSDYLLSIIEGMEDREYVYLNSKILKIYIIPQMDKIHIRIEI